MTKYQIQSYALGGERYPYRFYYFSVVTLSDTTMFIIHFGWYQVQMFEE